MDLLHIYKQEMKKAKFIESRLQNFSGFFNGLYMEMDKNAGQGFSEILFIRSGLYVERNDYLVHNNITSHHSINFTGLRFGIMLSGNVDMEISGGSYMNMMPGTLWCGRINYDSCVFKQFAGEKIRSLSIELPDNFIESWLGSACCQESRQLEAWVKLQNSPDTSKEGWRVLTHNQGKMTDCTRIAEKLLALKGQTFVDSLHYESLALDFLSSILTLNNSKIENCYPKWNRLVAGRVDDAINILCQEFVDPPSISSLARRVGINECYLKKGFREKTGETIGGFIRNLRMKKARELLESGKYSVLDTAIFVGYSNPGHFSMAFKKMYGYSPSAFLPRFSQM